MTIFYSIKSSVVSKKTENGWIILNPDAKSYRQLNQTAGFIWNLLQKKPETIDTICQKLVSAYKIDLITAKTDAQSFVDDYLKLNFLEKSTK